MKKNLIVIVLLLLTLSLGCSRSSEDNVSTSDRSATESVESDEGTLFDGKCANNQQWMADLVQAITIPANWQRVYDLTSLDFVSDPWGTFVGGEGNIFTDRESAEWGFYTGRISIEVVNGNYSEAIRMYERFYPLMEKMDLACGVAVTGRAALPTTVLP